MTTKTPAQELREIASELQEDHDIHGMAKDIRHIANRLDRDQPRVVMPPRAILVGGPEVYEGVSAEVYARIYNDGWNDCIAEFLRMNPWVKP